MMRQAFVVAAEACLENPDVCFAALEERLCVSLCHSPDVFVDYHTLPPISICDNSFCCYVTEMLRTFNSNHFRGSCPARQ